MCHLNFRFVQTGSKFITKQVSYELPKMRSISEVQTQDQFILRKGIHSEDKETTYIYIQTKTTKSPLKRKKK